jgi:uncharacterized repeat protein (TIGR01451 family)
MSSSIDDLNCIVHDRYQHYPGFLSRDENSKHFEWSAGVGVNNSELNIGKWPWTWDPVAGQDFIYSVNICNNGSTSSSEVYITDTLPVSVTLVNWWGQHPGWEEVSFTGDKLVVKHPTIPGYWCSEVYINLHLDEQAWEGMPLHNDAWVWSSSDTSSDNNYAWADSNVGHPRYNLSLNNQWINGQLVPGGYLNFDFIISNYDNMPIPGTVLTTTLPQGMEFVSAEINNGYGWNPFIPIIITDEYIMWDIGTIPNGFNYQVGIQLNISGDTLPGTPLVIENFVRGEALEYRYDDNMIIIDEMVNEPGPNLRADKHPMVLELARPALL